METCIVFRITGITTPIPTGKKASPEESTKVQETRRFAMYDAIVVGARCAGSPTAMLLARKGYRVLLVDKATFPSDTISTHFIRLPGVARLKRWGVLDKIIASHCPPIATFTIDLGPFT